jgi:formate hydrogenlyase transcriptional activator
VPEAEFTQTNHFIRRGVAMDVHPGPEKRRVAQVKLAQVDLIRRALSENEDWYQDLVEHSHDLLCIHDLAGRLLSVNPAPARMLGYSVEEILQIPLRELIAPEFRPQFDAYLSQIERVGEARGFMTVMTRAGERRIWEYHNTLRSEGVETPIVRGLAHDVTEQKSAEKLAREASENLLNKVGENERTIRELKLFRTLVDHSNDAIEVVDPGTLRFLDVNEKACSALGYSREELLSMRVFDIDPTVTEASREKDKQALRKSGFVVTEKLHRRKDGSTFPVEVSMRWVGLERDYVIVICRDLTERKQAEEALKKSEEKFSKAFRQGPLSLTLTSIKDHRYIEVNQAFERMTGWRRKEVIGRTPFDIGLWVDPDEMVQLARRLLTEGSLRNVEAPFRTKDGVLRIGTGTAEIIQLNGEPCAIAVVADITERKRAEEAIAALVQVRADSSESFFNSMAIELARCLEADYTIIGEIPQGEEGKVRTIGVCGQGVIAENFSRELAGTPCGLVIERGTSSYAAGVTEIFPRDFLLKQMKVEGYAGTPLNDSQGRVIGLMVALYTRSLANAKFAEMILRLFSTRTAAEIERKRTEDALRQSEERFRIALSCAPVKIFNQDRDLRYTWVYNLPEGWTEQDCLGKTDEEIFDPENAAKMVALKRPVLETGRGTRHEFALTARGKTYHCDITVEPLIDGAGQVVGVNCACVDITHLREVTEELRLAKEKLAEEKLYLEEAIDTELGFGEIIGRSSALEEVMAKVAKVAPSDATVLLLGETGTGKELVARALHRMSHREGNSFIKLNCAAIPSGLFESELFGHEKGAFTGAVARKLGRLELADRGTLFLDEIGEIPLSLQPKLLRVLQDQEFERLGGTQTLKVNFRLLAATNRDLLQSVKEHEFRSDLYYRLNVFPIYIPPLRERREDIRPLVEHFVRKFASKMRKSITSIPSRTMESLVRWEWPGNIRELENFLERSVILTPGSVLQSPLSELQAAEGEDNGGKTDSRRDKERERILRALRECHGRLGGPDGAAARLGLNRTTLQYRLDQFGIKPGAFRS